MKISNILSYELLDAIVVEPRKENIFIRLYKKTADEINEKETRYYYDSVSFIFPFAHDNLYNYIKEDFDTWWAYGQMTHAEETLEERVCRLEKIIFNILTPAEVWSLVDINAITEYQAISICGPRPKNK